ncbi:MAG TPA: hypothetical protein VFD77_00160, partial [Brumimicrobium sp.]|nr:hypothetical protein [Brumimicrobium sp.]
TELNNDYFTVKHSTDGFNFSEIGQRNGAGTVFSIQVYNMVHRNPSSGVNYYQLSSTDYDGTKYDKGIISVLVDQEHLIYNQFTSQLLFPEKGDYIMYNISGQKIAEIQNKTHYSFQMTGIYLIYNQKTGVVTKIAIP